MAFDSNGNLFVVDGNNHKIKKLVFDPSSGAATSSDFAGSGAYGEANGIGTDAEFRHPYGIVIDANDNLYISDQNNHKIRKITSSGDVTDYAGSGWGSNDGSLSTTRFRNPSAMAMDSTGDIYVADQGSNTIAKIDVSEGYVSRYAGKVIDNNSHLDGSLDEAKFSRSSSISINASSIFVVDIESHRIRKIDLFPSITIPVGESSASLTLKVLTIIILKMQKPLLWELVQKLMLVMIVHSQIFQLLLIVAILFQLFDYHLKKIFLMKVEQLRLKFL
jgi:hypothetical protein